MNEALKKEPDPLAIAKHDPPAAKLDGDAIASYDRDLP
jgi:hypothetical protein